MKNGVTIMCRLQALSGLPLLSSSLILCKFTGSIVTLLHKLIIREMRVQYLTVS